jgi:hypothetical protein
MVGIWGLVDVKYIQLTHKICNVRQEDVHLFRKKY